MANLSWGKPTIKLKKLVDGVETGAFIDVNLVVQGSTQLTSTKGTRREAPLEGGDFADLAYNKNTYVLEFEIYAKKGTSKPVTDVDGVINDEYAVYVQPEDSTVEGVKIPRSHLTMDYSFSADIGVKWKYTADVLPPTTGASILHQVITFV